MGSRQNQNRLDFLNGFTLEVQKYFGGRYHLVYRTHRWRNHH